MEKESQIPQNAEIRSQKVIDAQREYEKLLPSEVQLVERAMEKFKGKTVEDILVDGTGDVHFRFGGVVLSFKARSAEVAKRYIITQDSDDNNTEKLNK